MDASDEHQAFVKGLDGVPADMMVTFCEPLPDGTYCNLCQNVFPALHRDPEGHHFCESCKKMATTDNVFECPEDSHVFSPKQLTLIKSVFQEIWTRKLYCPNSPKDEPAHLHQCQCAIAARKQDNVVPGPRLRSGATMSPVKKDDHVEVTKSALELQTTPLQKTDEENKAPAALKQDSQCPHCDEWFPKREIKLHIRQKACSREQAQSLCSTPVQPQNVVEPGRSLPPVFEMEWANSGPQTETLNNPLDAKADGVGEYERRESATKDQDVATQVSAAAVPFRILSRLPSTRTST
ncbi:unnamed protein product [Ixodes hexagonus]